MPLPLVSYGGTSFVTLMAGFGILMSLYSTVSSWDEDDQRDSDAADADSLPCARPVTALALDATREDVRKFAEEMKKKHGFDAAWLDTVIADAKSQPKIIESMSKPAESVLTWHKYSQLMLTEERTAAASSSGRTPRRLPRSSARPALAKRKNT